MRVRVLKVGVFATALLPAVVLAWDAWRDRLGADPIEEITHRTGWWALTFLLIALAVTPVRRLTKWNGLVRFRRMLGLFAFFYACLHLLTYVVLDLYFAFGTVLEDVAKRPYITVGFGAFLILLALAVTSTKGWVRRLGKRWQRLHRLVYLAAIGGVVHFLWGVKADVREPLVFGAVLAILLVARIRRPKRRGTATPTVSLADPASAVS